MNIPYVKKDEKGIATLYVNDKPFFCKAGEIHNSSSSDPEYMKEHVWPALRGLHMNSVIAPVYWEMIEPEEGMYDLSSVKSLICQAREEGLKLIFLWFGLWKNAESMYVPAWVKKDTKTYFRAEKIRGEQMTTISPLCKAAVEKDRKAFTALMSFLKEFDGEEGTVIMIQVENEIGLLETDRDYCEAAQEAFSEQVPPAIEELTSRSGDWKSVFGEEAGEKFMAWQFACAVESIASSGRKEYALPCYANAWLRQYPWYPGSYPSGGPVVEVQEIWRKAAPSLFAFGPDIYVPYCADVMDEYASGDNPLVIPEIRKDAVTASYALYAFGGKNAICYSPFGIEELSLDPSEIQAPPMEVMVALNIDPSAFNITDSCAYLSRVYGMMEEMEPLYLKYRGTPHLKAFIRHGEHDYGTVLHFEKYDVAIAYAPRMEAKPLGAGLIMDLEPDKFLLVGTRCTLRFMPKPGVKKTADILRLTEGTIEKGEWKQGRILNGDEKMSLQFPDMPTAMMLEMYQF